MSVFRARVILLAVKGCVCTLPRAHTRAHYYVCYLTVIVKICRLGSKFAVALAGSMV